MFMNRVVLRALVVHQIPGAEQFDGTFTNSLTQQPFFASRRLGLYVLPATKGVCKQ